ncbi:MAG: putative transcriptional regulator containing the CopG/Arc/MetJ DNA-binding domain [Cellvibrio sp.]|jgi:antitoxin ParD1/3/4|nr:putative transcriptional regulator containing the CopG/Arc/MetJ DNA-binding domain [Cellvibrio sp.]
MARTITFQPSQELNDFIEGLVKGGAYNNQSEVVRAGLRLLQEQAASSSLQQLRSLIDEGEQSGELADWNLDKFLTRMKKAKDGHN